LWRRESVLLHWRQNRTLSLGKILLQKLHGDDCPTPSLMSDLELQREQELAEARAIHIGKLPQGALRTAKRNGAIGTSRLGNFLSDGFCEAQNSVGAFFGMESVLEVCENSRENSPDEILQRLTETVVSYSRGRPQQDDRTAAILRYIGK